jgi:hypothetical protein
MLPLLAAAAIAIPLAATHREVSSEGFIAVNVKLGYVTELEFVGSKEVAIIPVGNLGRAMEIPSSGKLRLVEECFGYSAARLPGHRWRRAVHQHHNHSRRW